MYVIKNGSTTLLAVRAWRHLKARLWMILISWAFTNYLRLGYHLGRLGDKWHPMCSQGDTSQKILWHIARQRLAKHVPELYAVNEDSRQLLGNRFGYHGIIGVSGTTQTWTAVMKPLQRWCVIGSPAFYKRPCLRQYLSIQ
jgi:hypothetical protein